MMTLLSKIEKIEASLRYSAAGAVLLPEPATDANAEIWEQFATNVFEAQGDGRRVIVRASGAPTFRRIPGAEYFDDDLAALLELMSYTAANDGKNNAVRQAIGQAQGHSLPIVREVKP